MVEEKLTRGGGGAADPRDPRTPFGRHPKFLDQRVSRSARRVSPAVSLFPLLAVIAGGSSPISGVDDARRYANELVQAHGGGADVFIGCLFRRLRRCRSCFSSILRWCRRPSGSHATPFLCLPRSFQTSAGPRVRDLTRLLVRTRRPRQRRPGLQHLHRARAVRADRGRPRRASSWRSSCRVLWYGSTIRVALHGPRRLTSCDLAGIERPSASPSPSSWPTPAAPMDDAKTRSRTGHPTDFGKGSEGAQAASPAYRRRALLKVQTKTAALHLTTHRYLMEADQGVMSIRVGVPLHRPRSSVASGRAARLGALPPSGLYRRRRIALAVWLSKTASKEFRDMEAEISGGERSTTASRARSVRNRSLRHKYARTTQPPVYLPHGESWCVFFHARGLRVGGKTRAVSRLINPFDPAAREALRSQCFRVAAHVFVGIRSPGHAPADLGMPYPVDRSVWKSSEALCR